MGAIRLLAHIGKTASIKRVPWIIGHGQDLSTSLGKRSRLSLPASDKGNAELQIEMSAYPNREILLPEMGGIMNGACVSA